MTGTVTSRRRRSIAAIGAATLAAGVSLTFLASPAFADVEDYFELEGNVLDGASPAPD